MQNQPAIQDDSFAKARERYRPDSVRVLWIAESPPTSGSYFYFDRATGQDHLFRETMRAIGCWPDSETLRKGMDKRPLLEKFRMKGHFLVDTSPYPVDKLSPAKRRMALNDGLPVLRRTVGEAEPEHVIIVKSNVYPLARPILESMGMGDRVLNHVPLPFPTHGRQKHFRTRVRRLLKPTGTL